MQCKDAEGIQLEAGVHCARLLQCKQQIGVKALRHYCGMVRRCIAEKRRLQVVNETYLEKQNWLLPL